jgi:DNA/RNA-binding domain of Phe-tRNA-synthetase-like protein
MRRTFAGAFVALGAKLALSERWRPFPPLSPVAAIASAPRSWPVRDERATRGTGRPHRRRGGAGAGRRAASGQRAAWSMGSLQHVDIQIAGGWRTAYPEAHVGILAMDGVENPPQHAALTEHVHQVEAELRRRWAGATRADLSQLPEFAAYRGYYRRFGKTYHVQLQFESVVLKGKPLRGNGSLVLAMFAAELRNRLLTAGHDLTMLAGGVSIDVAQGGERYVGLGGRELVLQPGDMHIRDEAGIISSVLYGPDERTQITPHTRRVLFCVYAPAGIRPEAVASHLADIAGTVRLVAPRASVIQQQVYATS